MKVWSAPSGTEDSDRKTRLENDDYRSATILLKGCKLKTYKKLQYL